MNIFRKLFAKTSEPPTTILLPKDKRMWMVDLAGLQLIDGKLRLAPDWDVYVLASWPFDPSLGTYGSGYKSSRYKSKKSTG